ncbi:Cytochrome [Abeliophyllum distichum]|uniref:Cytochrome n=1 Tax=Abeliophyllum distichum TaxID=126358 RepID=A0ABD1Q9F0_9LAMI
MDVYFPFNFSTLIFLVPLIFFLLQFKKSIKSKAHKNFPPGPKKLPIIGHLHLISSLPYRSYRDLAKTYGPIMQLQLGELPILVISSPEIAKSVLKDHDPCFADRPQTIALKIMWYDYIDIAFAPYGNYWRQMRKICIIELLSPKNVRSFGSIRNDEVSRLIKYIRSSLGQPINLNEKTTSLTSSITCRAAFGKVCKDSGTFIKLMNKAIELAGGLVIADFFPSSKIVNTLSWSKIRLLMMRCKMDVILDNILNEHKDSISKRNGEFGNEDLVDVLLRVKESGELDLPINDANIKAIIYDIFTGGTETSSSTINWTMAELIKNPRVMAKAQAEVREIFKGSKIIDENKIRNLKYLKLVIKEALRLHPPIPLVPRCSREEIEISGYTIPVKIQVFINNWAMQRDPKYWSNPENFEPERFEKSSIDFVGGDFQFLPFGPGRRVCPGMTFGLANVELPLAQLLYNFDWKLPNGIEPEDLNMIENPGITSSRKENLYVIATPYELA